MKSQANRPRLVWSLCFLSASAGVNAQIQEPLNANIDPLKYKAACPDYKNYAMRQQ